MKNIVYRLFQNTGLIIISLGLLYGGVAIIKSEIPFWNLVYGLPAISMGILMALVTFNELTKNQTAKASEYHLIACAICKKETLAPLLIERVTCTDCQYKMAVKLQMGALVFFLLLALPVTYHLSQQAQDIRQNAQEKSSQCEVGLWEPEVCRCGAWQGALSCGDGQRARVCNGIEFCCGEANGKFSCDPRK